MRLYEIAEKIGVAVVDLNQDSILQAERNGKISRGEAEKLLAELEKADNIWENGGAPVAESLW